ncbi:MAG: flavodoxin domain-containing protein [Roseburia sp.]|nr:flavodoxin domain-containing protein [Roseburia sp.]
MDKIYVVYWSQSGNTQAMAEAVGNGIAAACREAAVVSVGEVSKGEISKGEICMDELKKAKCFALGCPAMGAEVLEEMEMEPFVVEVEGFAAGKSIALFGSYGWGDGQWMRDWVERMERAGAVVLNGEGLICQDAPDGDALAECEALGRQLAGI